MSDSAYGRVIYGYGPQDHSYLSLAGEDSLACSTDLSHEVSKEPHCPQCGGGTVRTLSWVPSPLVEAYAARHKMNSEQALEALEPYQHRLIVNDEGDYSYFFGVLLAEGSDMSSTTFRPVDSNDDLDRDMLEVIRGKYLLRECFGDNLREAKYHLLVELDLGYF